MSFGYRNWWFYAFIFMQMESLYIQRDNFIDILYFMIYSKKPFFSNDKQLKESSPVWRSLELSDATSCLNMSENNAPGHARSWQIKLM